MDKIKYIFLLTFLFLCIFAIEQSEARPKKQKTPKVISPPPFTTTEIKLLLSDSSHEDFLSWIKNQKSVFEQKHIFFFDTKDLILFKNGITLRVRRMQDETFDSTVKVRSQTLENLPEISKKGFKNLSCEIEVIEGTQLKECDLTRREKKILPSIDSKNANSFFNKDQTKFTKYFFKDLKWNDLKYWGRIISNKWEISEGTKNLACELWTLPNSKRLIECSVKAPIENIEIEKKFLSEYLTKNKIKVEENSKSKFQVAFDILQPSSEENKGKEP